MKKLIYLLSFMLAFTVSRYTVAQEVPGTNSPADDSLQFHLQKAQTLVKQGKKEEASKVLTGIMATHPDNKEAVQWWLIANMKRSPTGEVDAIPMLDSLSRIYPANTAIMYFKIFIQAENGMNQEALANADKLISIQPADADNWLIKGQILAGMEKHGDACKAFDKALKLNPARTDVLGMKASSQAKTGKFNDALSTINKGIKLDPKSPVNYYNRACIYSLKGDKTMALADLKKVFETNPEYKKYAATDPDLKALNDLEEFKNLMK